MRNHSYENEFDLHENETACRTHFHMKGFALRLVLKQRHKRTRKWPIVNQQRVVYGFQCDLCDAGYVGYTREHLHNRVKGHKQQSSALPNTARTCTGQCLRAC